MVRLNRSDSEIFIPDGAELDVALQRSTMMVVAAHQDDIEQLAMHGIVKGLEEGGYRLFGVVASDGAGDRHTGSYTDLSYAELMEVRDREQRRAAVVGRYSAVAMLNHTSPEIKDKSSTHVDEDLVALLEAVRPQSVYMHNPFDRNDTHIALFIRTIEALRTAASHGFVPKHVYGCEAWRGLDWLIHHDSIHLPVNDEAGIGERLIQIYRSQFNDRKYYDLAARGRRIANATRHESHTIEMDEEVVLAVDLLPLVLDATLEPETFARRIIERFETDVRERLKRYRGI